MTGPLISARDVERRWPPEGHFVQVGDARLHFTERQPIGAARGAILLVHGASGNQADMILPLGDRLAAEGFRVLAFDRPGLGWSERAHGADDAPPRAQALLLCDAARACGVERALVVGHSLGGAVAAEMALERPHFVQGLVLLAPATHPWPGGVAWYYGAAGHSLFGSLFARLAAIPLGLIAMDAALRTVFEPQQTPERYADLTGAALVLTPRRFHDNAQDVLALQRAVPDLASRLPFITAPTAIVTGDADRVVSPDIHSRPAAAAIPGARLTVLSGIGHSVHWARPDAVVEAVLDVARRSRETEIGQTNRSDRESETALGP